jgi:hypothetical protein
MRVKTPLGDYDYRVRGVRLTGGGLEIRGSLGQWETTTVAEPKELAAALAAIVVPVALLLRRRR